MNAHIRYEVWLGEWWYGANSSPDTQKLEWRFNACFDEMKRAEQEMQWYRDHGYEILELRMRTTRYQRREHVTTG